LEGKSAVPQVMVGEDDFVELDESGAPRRAPAGRGRPRPQAPVRARKPARPPAAAAVEAAAAGVAADGAQAEAAPVVAEAALDEPAVAGTVPEGGKEQIGNTRRRPTGPSAGGARRGGRC